MVFALCLLEQAKLACLCPDCMMATRLDLEGSALPLILLLRAQLVFTPQHSCRACTTNWKLSNLLTHHKMYAGMF